MVHYLALACDGNTDAQLQCLTPSVMQWADTDWVMALHPVMAYWRGIAGDSPDRHTAILGIWKRTLCSAFFPNLKPPTTPFEWEQLPVQAVWAHHPFVALLMMSHMKHSTQFGWIVEGGPRFNHIWQRVNWATWEHAVKTCLGHWDRCKAKGFTLNNATQSLSRLMRLIRRLGIAKPADLYQLPIEGIRRRFGPWMAHCCDWTRLDAPDIRYFPWQQWQPPLTITKTRHLDDPTHDWSGLTGVLCDDLDTLSAQLRGGITAMTWALQFETNEWISFPIRFRNPHAAQREQGKHPTILRQFQAVLAQFNHRRRITQLPRITGWTLEITGQLALTATQLTLFDFEADAAHEAALAQLENNVPIPLDRFQRVAHWTPGDDWTIGIARDTPWQAIHTGETMGAPLFFWRTPRRIQGDRPSRTTDSFTTLIPWWKGAKAQWDRWYEARRINGQSEWAYWDGAGWWSVGLYG